MMTQTKQLAEEYGIDYLDSVEKSMIDPALIASIPVTWVREQNVLPIRRGGVPVLLMSTVGGMEALQHVALVIGDDLSPVFVEPDVLGAAIERAYYEGKSTEVTAHQKPEPSATEPARVYLNTSHENDLLVDQESQPVTQYLNNVLLEAVRRDASDVHLDPDSFEAVRVRFRLDGVLYEQASPPRGYAAPMVSRIKVMAGMDIAERRLPQDGMAQVRVGERIVDIRVSTVPVADGERVVLRLLNRERSLLPLSNLGMPDAVLAGIHSMLNLPNGMVVVSGPTGSGKTTTLYSALGALDAGRRNIMTIEDPIEYRLPDIAQIQVKPKIGLTFASGLRHILRQDPDVVLVGETRDAETAEIAVRSSLTGHLVFTTLHTNDAASAVMRLVDMGVESYLLASCLRGVLAQRLVRRVCPRCSQVISFDDPSLHAKEISTARAAGCTGVRRAVGCSQCLEGYVGRLGIFEFLPCGPEIEESIHRGTLSAEELKLVASQHETYYSMATDAAVKLREGVTTPAEIISIIGGL